MANRGRVGEVSAETALATLRAACEAGTTLLDTADVYGLLAGHYTRATVFPADDHRTFHRDGQQFNVGETFAGLPFEKGVDLADALKLMVPAGRSLPELALRWCFDLDTVSAIIPGARNPQQARANARVSALRPLGPELHARLSDFYTREVEAQIRGSY